MPRNPDDRTFRELVAVVAGVSLFLLSLSAAASALPQTMAIQGKLTDDNGVPLSGYYNFTFRLYSASAGGPPLWEENQTLNVSNGIFTTYLGSKTPLNLSFDEDYALGTEVNSGGELSPRVNLTSVPYTFTANVSERNVRTSGDNMTGNLNMSGNDILNAGSLYATNVYQGGNLLSNLYCLLTGCTISGNLNVNQNLTVDTNTLLVDSTQHRVGIGLLNPQQLLDVAGAIRIAGAAASAIPGTIRFTSSGFEGYNGSQWLTMGTGATAGSGYWNANGVDIYNMNGGNVGIGTSGPNAMLDVNGNASFSDNVTVSGDLNVTGTSYLGNIVLSAENITVDNLLNYSTAGVNVPNDFYVGGNVGIGTANPQTKLQVVDNVPGNSYTYFSNIDTGATSAVGWVTRLAQDDGTTRTGSLILTGKEQAWTSTASTRDSFMSFATSLNGAATEKMRIDSNGNVGIGTTNPQTLLSINGSGAFQIGSNTDTSYVQIGNSYVGINRNNGPGYILNGNNSNSAALIIGVGPNVSMGVYALSINSNNSVGIGNTPTTGNIFSVYPKNANVYFVVQNGTGNVGIGTTNPNSKLEVNGGLNVSNVLFVNSTSGNVGIRTTSPDQRFVVNGTSEIITNGLNTEILKMVYNTTSQDQGRFSWNSNGAFTYDAKHGGSWKLGILSINDSSGNVGIGTTNPTYKLDVESSGGNDGIHLLNDTGSDIAGLLQSTGLGGYGYLRLSNAETANVIITSSGNSFLNGGNVGIGTTSPGAPLEINTTTDYPLRLRQSGGGWNYIEFYNDTARTAYIGMASNGKDFLINPTNGNVGIGTTSPGAKLTISDLSYPGLDYLIRIENPSYDSGMKLGIYNTTSGMASIQSYRVAGGAVDKLLLNPDGGNVGIGTTNPTARLTLKAGGTSSADNFQIISSSNSDKVVYLGDFVNASGDEGGLQLLMGGSSGVLLRAGGNSYFKNGNVGIGTTTPSAPLEVANSSSTGQMVLLRDSYAATYSDSSPNGYIGFDSRYAGQTTDWATARIKWGYADTYGNNGARFGIDIANSTGEWASVITILGNRHIRIGDGPSNTNQMFRVYDSGADPFGVAEIVGSRQPVDTWGQFIVEAYSPTGYEADNGGQMDFAGQFETSNTIPFAAIAGRKENSVSGDPSGYLQFSTANTSYNMNERMRITSTGSVGIGTTSPQNTLNVIGTFNVTTLGSASSTAVCWNAGELTTCSSSERYKKDIQNVQYSDNILSKYMQLQPVSFYFKNSSDIQHHLGLIAEDVATIFPDYVFNMTRPIYSVSHVIVPVNTTVPIYENGTEIGQNTTITYENRTITNITGYNNSIEGITYSDLTTLNLLIIQQQQKEIEQQNTTISALKTQGQALKQCILSGTSLTDIQNCVGAT